MATQTQEKQKQKETCTTNPIGWVEIPANDLDRAKSFYQKTFGFEFHTEKLDQYEMATFPMSSEGKGASGALVKGATYNPSKDGSVVYFSVEDIPGTLKKAVSAGGQVVADKKSIGEYGFIAFFKDSEGNRVALHSKS